MRVIAGEFRRRVLRAPDGVATRPTSDRLRETLFNVLARRTAGSRFLDLYAGSGAVGIEALSRGASEVVFVEKAPSAVKVIRENLEELGVREGTRVHMSAVATFLRSALGNFDIVFLDPPYDSAGEYPATLGFFGAVTSEGKHPILAQGGVVIAEHRRKETLAERFGALLRRRLLEQGDAALSFYSMEDSTESPTAPRG